MIKAASAAIASLAIAAPALAGPYANIENNAGWAGSTFGGSSTDLHIGYEGAGESTSWYIQGGPAIVAVDGVENETRFSGKIGASAALSSSVGVYGELSAITASDELSTSDLGVGGKLGVKYSF